jgi:chemotaxis protein CheD
MHKPAQIIEIFLQPGELYFGGRDTRIRTILGSCVSLVFWHPRALVGGMCHFMLPERGEIQGGRLDGRYADEAIELALREMRACGTHPRDYKVKLFGGGNMFPEITTKKAGRVGLKNVLAARELIQRHGFDCVSEHVEGTGHRNLVFEVWSGIVAVRHRAPATFPQDDGKPVPGDRPSRSNNEAALLLPLQFPQGGPVAAGSLAAAPAAMPNDDSKRAPSGGSSRFIEKRKAIVGAAD